MLASVLIFSLLASQALAAYPLAWDFVKVALSRDAVYKLLILRTNSGLKPLYFPRTNTTVDYFGETWRDPCYERYNELNQKSIVVFWLVNEEVYCEVYIPVSGTITFTPPYPATNLMRAEVKGDRCPNIPR